jgi:uncharacterized membrane protein
MNTEIKELMATIGELFYQNKVYRAKIAELEQSLRDKQEQISLLQHGSSKQRNTTP